MWDSKFQEAGHIYRGLSGQSSGVRQSEVQVGGEEGQRSQEHGSAWGICGKAALCHQCQ